MLFTCNLAMSSMPFLPLGRVQMFQVESPNVIATGTITNPYGPLKLGGFTNVSGTTGSYLLISSQADGVHLNEPTTDRVIFDTPLTTTQPFKAVSISSTGNGTIGGDLAIGGATALQAVAVAGNAAFAQGVTVAGLVSASSVTVNGLTSLQGDTAVGGGLAVAGDVIFQQALTCGPLLASSANVHGDSSVGGLSTTQSLTVAASGSLGSLSVSGNSAMNTLSTVSTAAFGAGVMVGADLAIGGGLTVNGSGVTVPSGGISVAGAQVTATTNTFAVSVGGTAALSIDASQNLTLSSGSLTTSSVNGINNQSLVLKGADPAGTVHIAGNLVVDGDYETANKVRMQVEDTLLTLAHSQTTPKPDSVADGAGIEIEGNSGFTKSITWKNNLGLAYNGQSGGLATEDGLSYFQGQGGNLLMTRTIPAANHISRSAISGTWQADSVQTVVSYAFRIDDQENLQIAKTQGTDYSSVVNGSYAAIGQTASVCATYEVSLKS